MANQTAANNLEHAEKMAAHWLYLANMAAERGDYELEKRHLAREQKWHDIMNNLLGLGEAEPIAAPVETPSPEAAADDDDDAVCDYCGEHVYNTIDGLCMHCRRSGIMPVEQMLRESELDTLRAENEARKLQLAAARVACVELEAEMQKTLRMGTASRMLNETLKAYLALEAAYNRVCSIRMDLTDESPAALQVGDMATFVSTIGVHYLCQIDRVLPNGRVYAYGYSALVPHHFFYQRVDTIPTLRRAPLNVEFPEVPDMAWIAQMRSDQLGDFDVKDDRAGNHSQWNGLDQLNPDAR